MIVHDIDTLHLEDVPSRPERVDPFTVMLSPVPKPSAVR